MLIFVRSFGSNLSKALDLHNSFLVLNVMKLFNCRSHYLIFIGHAVRDLFVCVTFGDKTAGIK